MTLEKTIYQGSYVHSKSQTELDYVERAQIGVNGDGKIAFIKHDLTSTLPEGWDDAKVIKIPEPGFFFPGFIDTHIHAPQYPNAGIFGKTTLLDWLKKYTFPLENSFSDLKKAQRIYNQIVSRTLSHGTTTACYYATIHVPATNLLADICLKRGQKAFVGRVCMDQSVDLDNPDFYRDASAEASVESTKQCIEHVKNIDPNHDLISPIITPRFAPSCSIESMHALGKLHKETGIPVQTHIDENKPEIDLVKETFPKAPHYAGVYDSAGLLTSKTILAHCVWLSPEERQLIKERDAKISHCPASNTALKSGCAPIRQLLNEGLTIGLGTDVSGGYTPSILAQCREALFVSRFRAMNDGDYAALSVEETLYLATRGGAKVVGLEDRIGGFEVGKDWDAQFIHLETVKDDDEFDQITGPAETFGHEDWNDKIEKWVCTGDDRNTHAVWVKGRLVHVKNGVKF
ncbi:hypothetical protein AC579_1599 [Pseudocercospora musae]|uniref:Guanine deaminase n=1 Tax=Pseudocercospora musae TaxID=113226 RepID=A0A139HTG5_9PEZI|nr:hypothetical protein AC579_1599 [Pseudocercospora musae]